MQYSVRESGQRQNDPALSPGQQRMTKMDSTAQLQRTVGNQAVGALLHDTKLKYEIELTGLQDIKGKFSIEVDLQQPFFTHQKKNSGKARSVIETKVKSSSSDFTKAASELSLTALEYDVGSWQFDGVSVEIKLGAGKIDVSDKVDVGLLSLGVEAQGVINATTGYAPVAQIFFSDAEVADFVANGLEIKYGLSAEVSIDLQDFENWRRQRQLNARLAEAEGKAKQLTDEGLRLSDEIKEVEKSAEALERAAKKNARLLERKRAKLEKLIEKQKIKADRRLTDLRDAIEEIEKKQDAIANELSAAEDLIGQKKKRIAGIADEVHDIAVEAKRHTQEIERLASSMKGRLAKLVSKRLFKTALKFLSHIFGPIALLLDAIDLLKIALYFNYLTLAEGIPLDELPFFPPDKGPKEAEPALPAAAAGPAATTTSSSADGEPRGKSSEPKGDASEGTATATGNDSGTASSAGPTGDRSISQAKLDELTMHPVADYVHDIISDATAGPSFGDGDIDELIRIVDEAALTIQQAEGLRRLVKSDNQRTAKDVLDNLRQVVQEAAKKPAEETGSPKSGSGPPGDPDAVESTSGISPGPKKETEPPVHELQPVKAAVDLSKLKKFDAVRYLYLEQFNPAKSLNVPLTATIAGRIPQLNNYAYRMQGVTIIVTSYDPQSQKVTFQFPATVTWAELGGYQHVYHPGTDYMATYKSGR